MKDKAYGKINLSIDVIGKRMDGYHLLDMIMLPIDIYDEIEIRKSKEMKYECNIDLPFDKNNLIYKAIEILRNEFGFTDNFSIKVNKFIPMGAGLAGGSSDAAATMRILNKLLKLKLTRKQLATYGAKIGSDIPFCIINKPARVKSTGDIVEPFVLKQPYSLLLVKPEKPVSTKIAYEMVDKNNEVHPDIGKLKEAFVKGEPISEYLGNSLQAPAIEMVPEIRDIISDCKKFGYANVLMTGSGSTVFVIEKGQCDFIELYENEKERYNFVCKCKVLS